MSHLVLVIGVLWASGAWAFEATLRIDSTSFIQQEGGVEEGFYRFPEGASVRVVFGPRDGTTIPVTIPQSGLRLGVARGPGMPPLLFALEAPAQGTLTLAGGAGHVSIRTVVLVTRLGAKKPLRYELDLEADLVKRGVASGYLMLTGGDAVKNTVFPETFYAAIGADLDVLPPGFE